MYRGLHRKSGGFTILETIIVLTVTIALLGSMLALFQGRIPRTQFAKAVNELSVRLTDVATQVADGNYPEISNINCATPPGGGLPTITTEATATGQGTSQDCIFLGQAVKFGSKNCNIGNNECDDLKIFTVAGSRKYTDLNGEHVVNSLSNASPNSSDTVAVQTYKLGYGLQIKKAYYIDDSNKVEGVAYLQQFGSSINLAGDPEGILPINLYPINGDVGVSPDGDFAGASIQTLGGTGVKPATIKVCLQSGTSDQYAILDLGLGGNAGDVQQRIVSKADWDADGCD